MVKVSTWASRISCSIRVGPLLGSYVRVGATRPAPIVSTAVPGHTPLHQAPSLTLSLFGNPSANQDRPYILSPDRNRRIGRISNGWRAAKDFLAPRGTGRDPLLNPFPVPSRLLLVLTLSRSSKLLAGIQIGFSAGRFSIPASSNHGEVVSDCERGVQEGC